MKPLLTRAFVRNVLGATGIAAACCGLAGVTASTAVASTGTSPGQPVPSPAAVDITITMQPTATSPTFYWTLTCNPDGGTLPDPVRVCGQISNIQLPPPVPPPHTVCPMIIYGPQMVTITGWWHDNWVSLKLDRTDGCEVARWNDLITALGLSGA